MAQFSERLKSLRAATGERQADVAGKVGVSVQSFSSYEMGREPKYEVLCKLAEHFRCTTDYLLGYSPYKNHQEKERSAEREKAFMEMADTLDNHSRDSLLNSLENMVAYAALLEDAGLQYKSVEKICHTVNAMAAMMRCSVEMRNAPADGSREWLGLYSFYHVACRRAAEYMDLLEADALRRGKNGADLKKLV